MKKLEPHPRTDHIVTSMTTEYKGCIGPIGVCVCVCVLFDETGDLNSKVF